MLVASVPHTSLASQLEFGDGATLVGDLGLVVLKALLENGVGYLVSGWLDPQNPVDAAISGVHRTLLPQLGVSLRRAGKLSQIERVLEQPGHVDLAATGGVLRRGAVVWNGERGTRPALERFCGLPVAAPVVGLCFDDEIVRSDTALVIDPSPTPDGVARAIDEAFALSHVMRRPVLVLLRASTRSMRGTLRCRDNVAVADAGALGEHLELGAPLHDAMQRVGIVDVDDLSSPTAQGDDVVRVLVACTRAHAQAAERAVARVQAALASATPDGLGITLDVRVVTLGIPTVVTPSGLGDALDARDAMLVLEPAGSGMGARVRRAVAAASRERLTGAVGAIADPVVRSVDTAAATEGAVLASVAGAIADVIESMRPAGSGTDATVALVRAALQPLVVAASAASMRSAAAAASARRLVGSTIVARDSRLHRPLSKPLAAALTLAQGSIGVPTRGSDDWPTYVTESGARLTVATATQIAADGRRCASPDAAHGVFVVVPDGTPAAAVQAAMPGAVFELVDELQPRLVAAAIARACARPAAHAHVIIPTPVGVVRAPRGELGIERGMAGGERVAFATLADEATYLRERHDVLDMGPRIELADPIAASAAVPVVAQLSSATYEIVRGGNADAVARTTRTARRSFLKSIFGVAT